MQTGESMTEETIKPEGELALVVERVVTNHDVDRLQSMVSLLNTFNYAVQVQGKRNEWNANDFRAFSIALCAMDEIGQRDAH
jgi:hypothetical protein